MTTAASAPTAGKAVPWPWHRREVFTCACCERVEEMFVEPTIAMPTEARIDLVKAAISGMGWLLVRDGAAAAWLCRLCAREVPEPHGKIFLDAVSRWILWTAITFVVATAGERHR